MYKIETDAWDVLDRFNEYLQLSSKDKLMATYREMGDDDLKLLECLYKELKRYGLANKEDIYNIFQQIENLKNLDKVLYETADEIGRLNSIKTQLEKDIEERLKMIGVYDTMMMENVQGTSG